MLAVIIITTCLEGCGQHITPFSQGLSGHTGEHPPHGNPGKGQRCQEAGQHRGRGERSILNCQQRVNGHLDKGYGLNTRADGGARRASLLRSRSHSGRDVTAKARRTLPAFLSRSPSSAPGRELPAANSVGDRHTEREPPPGPRHGLDAGHLGPEALTPGTVVAWSAPW